MNQFIEMIHRLAVSPFQQNIRLHIDPQRILDDAIAIQQIPAPTFDEAVRAAFIRDRFGRYPLQDVAIDDVFNVYGRWPGSNPTAPALLLAAHLDTVFPLDTDLTVRHDDALVYGPGLGDNSLGVAGMLTVLELFQQHGITPASDIWFVANSREEGLGDLGGIRAVVQRLRGQLGAAIIVEGMALGRIYHAGIAVRRLKIVCRAPGGHSWLHFGRPSAIHGLVELGADILKIRPSTEPRTTFNIGLINGGHSINSLARAAEIYLDLRSEAPQTLAELEQQIRGLIAAAERNDLNFEVRLVGDRPAGRIPTTHPLVQLATGALQAINHRVFYESGSTDANIPLAEGLPTVTVGISYGGNAHRNDEFIDTAPLIDGIWHLLLLVLSAAEYLPTLTVKSSS